MIAAVLTALLGMSQPACCDEHWDWVGATPPEVQPQVRRIVALHQAQEAPPAQAPAPAGKVEDPKHQKDIDDDIALGKEVAKEVDKQLKVSKSKAMIDRVERIGRELAAIANQTQVDTPWGDKRLSPFEYKFTVVEGDDVNAFSIPGGFIYIYEGLIKFSETDHELAGVIAHEISHAASRHVAVLRKEQSKVEAITIPAILIAILAGGETGQGAAMATQLVGQAIGSGWSVKAEKAADYGGVEYMARSGYNATGILTFMERLAFEDTNADIDWGIYRTHPPTKERVLAIRRLLEQRQIDVRRSETSTTFRAIPIEEVDGSHSIKLAGQILYTFRGEDAAERAESAAVKLSAFADSLPSLFEIESTLDGEVVGKGETLFKTASVDDLQGAKTPRQLADNALQKIKAAIYTLSFRVEIRR